MDVTFAKMIAEGWLITYMDDLSMIHSDDPDKHEERVQRVLQQMKENDLHLKLSKYFFNQKEVEYLGLILLRLAWVGMNVDSKGSSGVSDEHVGRVLVRLVDVFLVAKPARRHSERSCASKD